MHILNVIITDSSATPHLFIKHSESIFFFSGVLSESSQAAVQMAHIYCQHTVSISTLIDQGPQFYYELLTLLWAYRTMGGGLNKINESVNKNNVVFFLYTPHRNLFENLFKLLC